VPAFVLLVLSSRDHAWYRYAALGLGVVLGVSDAVDGILARRTGSVTRLGSVLDPLADKSLMLSAVITLSMPGVLSAENPDLHLPYWVSVPLVSRDLFILVGSGVVFLLAGVFQALPSFSGKAATVLQFVMIASMLVAPDFLDWAPTATWVGLYAVWGLTVGFGIISWLGYVRTGTKLLSANGQ
jgi:cardiolipin synthase